MDGKTELGDGAAECKRQEPGEQKSGAQVHSPDSIPAATAAVEAFRASFEIMARLRAPGGCPWDREQSFDTIRKHTLEEAYEVLDAIDRRNWGDLEEELGDLALQILFYAQMAAEAGYFDIAGVFGRLNRKLIYRHPHVFERDAQQLDSKAVLTQWDELKKAEKPPAAGLLASIPHNLPAVMEAAKMGSRAAKVGFDWPDVEGLFAKLEEETEEIREAIQMGAAEEIAEEYGDLLFTLVQLGRHLSVDAELALRAANGKFRRRFAGMEAEAAGSGTALDGMSDDQLDALWKAQKTVR